MVIILIRYQELLKADSKIALQILASFNTESALEMDIAREYLSKLEKKDKSLRELEEILKKHKSIHLKVYPFYLKKIRESKKENNKNISKLRSNFMERCFVKARNYRK